MRTSASALQLHQICLKHPGGVETVKYKVFQERRKVIEKLCCRLKQMADPDSPQAVFRRQSIQRARGKVVKMLQRHDKPIFPPALFSFYNRGIQTVQMEVTAGFKPAANIPEILMQVINVFDNRSRDNHVEFVFRTKLLRPAHVESLVPAESYSIQIYFHTHRFYPKNFAQIEQVTITASEIKQPYSFLILVFWFVESLI
jgi:hypothetical protein